MRPYAARVRVASAMLVGIALLGGCTPTAVPPSPTDTTPVETRSEITTDSGLQTTFALITDFGNCDDGERAVAGMVGSWEPTFIATAGDNIQAHEDCIPYAQSVGDYYGEFMTGPDGARFFPVPGNHDYENEGAGFEAYSRYFSYLGTLTDDLTRYRVSFGTVNLYMLDSESSAAQLEEQRGWLRDQLSTVHSQNPESWNIVVFHRPPFTSGPHEPDLEMRPDAGWDYGEWGVDLVVSGHQHVLEELNVDGVPYLIAGVGASDIARECPARLDASSTGCLSGIGALRVMGTSQTLTLEYRQPDGAEGVIARTFEYTRSSGE